MSDLEDKIEWMKRHELWLIKYISRREEVRWRLNELNEIFGKVRDCVISPITDDVNEKCMDLISAYEKVLNEEGYSDSPEVFFEAAALLYEQATFMHRPRGAGVNLFSHYTWLAKDYLEYGQLIKRKDAP